MWIYKARHDHTAARVQAGFMRISGAKLCAWANGNDLFIADQHGSILDDLQATQVTAALRPTGEREELRSGVDQHKREMEVAAAKLEPPDRRIMPRLGQFGNPQAKISLNY
jgi:hypothetical protein